MYIAVSQNLSTFGMMSMNGRTSIGSVISAILIGGTVMYGGQHDAIAASGDSLRVGMHVSGVALTDTMTATSSIAATGIAGDMTDSTATVHGVVYPQGAEISFWFEYSSDPLLGRVLIRRTPHVVLITDSDQKSVEADISGLTAHTRYYFRIVAENSTGTLRGNPVSFNTK